MNDNMRAYDDAVEASTSTLRDPSDYGPLDVRYIEGTSHGTPRRTIYTYLVVNHESEEVLHECRPARKHGVNPAPEEASAKAKGFAAGWLLAHPDHER
jgi:hypothetical protein